MNTITIKGNEYRIKGTLRAMFIFEQITKKPFGIESMLDNYIYFYSLLLANNNDVMDWDSFIDALDEDPDIYNQLNKILMQNSKIDELLNQDEDNPKNKGIKKN